MADYIDKMEEHLNHDATQYDLMIYSTAFSMYSFNLTYILIIADTLKSRHNKPRPKFVLLWTEHYQDFGIKPVKKVLVPLGTADTGDELFSLISDNGVTITQDEREYLMEAIKYTKGENMCFVIETELMWEGARVGTFQYCCLK